MGFIKKLFGGDKDIEERKELGKVSWCALTTVEQLNELKEASQTKPQLIFKHSTRCGVSRMVLRQFEGAYGFPEEDFDLNFLDLLNYREVSNAISSMFQVMHQSPQLLVIKNGVVVAHASHSAILELNLNDYV